MDKPDNEAHEKICGYLKMMTWGQTNELGINHQQMQRIKRGETVRFHAKTFSRLKTRFGIE